MTASPKVNGHTRPPAPPVLGDWQPIEATPTQADIPTTETAPNDGQGAELIAQAEAEAIRAKAWAESEERRLAAEAEKEAALKRAEAEAKAIEIKAEEESRKIRLANDRAERKAREDEAASEARIAESNLKRDDANRSREESARKAAEQRQTSEQEQEKQQRSEKSWRRAAKSFYGMCQLVALPVQTHAFWLPSAPWLVVAPIMLESGALVVQRGARAAVDDHRPHWHYRLISWCLAAVAASVNLAHGLAAFDPATAISTAFASLAGPGVYDLYEHGRIRKRDGVLTRGERKAAVKAAKAEAKRKAVEEAQRAAEKEAADKAADEAAEELAKMRGELFPKVWEHAVKLAADLGETDPNAVWERAKLDVDGAKPGESAEVLRMRNAAEMRVEAARQNKPVNTLSKTMNAQRVPHLPPGSGRGSKTGPKVRGVRRSGDAPRFSDAARKQAAITARQAAQNSRPNDN